MFRRPRFNITAKLVGYLLVAGIVPMLAFGFSAFQIAREIVIDQAGEYNLRLVSDAASYLRLYRNQVEDLAAQIAGNEGISRALNEADRKTAGSYETLNTRAQIGYILNNFVRVKGLVSIDLFTLQGTHFYIGQTLAAGDVKLDTVRQMMRETEAAGSPAFWRGVEDNINTASTQRKVITLTRVIRHYAPESGVNATVGLLVINLDDEIFRDYFSREFARSNIRMMAVDRHGHLMHHWDRKLIGQPLTSELLARVRGGKSSQQLQLDGENAILTTAPLPGIDGHLVFVTPLALHTAPVNRLAVAGAVLLLLGLAGIALLTRHYAKTVAIPLRSVSERFRHLHDDPEGAHAPLPVPREQDEIATLIDGFNSYIESLAAQRAAAAKLTQAEQTALESAHILRAAIEAFDEAFAVYNEQDQLVFCNEKYRSFWSIAGDPIASGVNFEQILREEIGRGRYPQAIGRVEEFVAERLAVHRGGNSDMEQRLDDGRWLRIVERKTPGGDIAGFAIDITQLKRSLEAAEEANLAKSRFLATMSHEIRTPMNGILGMAQLMLMSEVSDVERQDYARTILNSGQILLTLLNEILDLSKVEAGKLELEHAPVNPQQLIEETVAILAETARAKGVEVSAAWLGPAGQRYRADPTRLRQMVSNLVSNAVKFTSQGFVRVTANEVGREGKQATLEFSIEDSGIGVPPEKLPLLFKAFSQTDSSTTRQYGGTGLGLSIVRSLSKLMGGNVGVESEAGKGSRFWFRVPVQVLEAGEESRRAERNNEAGRQFQYSGQSATESSRHILVVEDNATNRKVVETLLGKMGLRTESVENGQQAVDAIARQGRRPDLVLMDVQMPVMDGIQAAEKIRQWERDTGQPRVPIVALTAGAFEEDSQRCIAAGMDDFLTKPINVAALAAVIAKWVGEKVADE